VAGFRRRARVAPVEYEPVEVWGQVQHRAKALYERDRPAMSEPYPRSPPRTSTLIANEMNLGWWIEGAS
jgi:hypothetical protein